MAGKKLYELDQHSSIVDTDVVAISATDSGDAEKSTAAEIKAYVKSGLSTADVSASTDKNYVTDAQATVIGNTSGTNSGDETESSIKTKLGITILSGNNTGDEDATSIKTKLGVSTLSGSNTGDQDLSGLASKINVLELDNTDAFTPTADYHPATKKYVDDNSGGGTGDVTASGTLTDNAILLGGGTTVAKTSSKTIVTTLGADNTTVPTSGAVAAAISGAGGGDVSGPASSTDSNVAMFNGTTGKLLKDSGVSLSGSNTGDEDTASIKTKLGTASTSTDGYVTSTDWNTFNGKQDALGYTAENSANKEASALDTSTTKYPCNNVVKNAVDGKMTNPMTTAGDIIYGGASGLPTRLPIGTAGQVLKVNSGATAVERGTGGGGSVGGSYVFAIAGTIGATGTNVSATHIANGDQTITSVDLWYGTAGSGTLTVDVNKNGTTIFSTTKPTITTTNQSSINSGTLTTTSLASGDILTIDIDAVPATTKPVDLYVRVNYS